MRGIREGILERVTTRLVVGKTMLSGPCKLTPTGRKGNEWGWISYLH